MLPPFDFYQHRSAFFMTFVLQTNAPPVPYSVCSLCFLVFLDARADVQFHRFGTSLFFTICRFAESESVVWFVVFTTETVNILEKKEHFKLRFVFWVGFFPHGPSLANVFWGFGFLFVAFSTHY